MQHHFLILVAVFLGYLAIPANLNAQDAAYREWPFQSERNTDGPTVFGSDRTRDDTQWRGVTSADSQEAFCVNDINRGDTVMVLENTTLRIGQQVLAEVAGGSQFRVIAISGNWVGVLGILDGTAYEGWVQRRVVTKANRLTAYGGQTSPSVYGSSIITFDNQSGEPALVRLVGPTLGEVFVPNGGRNSIYHVAAGNYFLLVRYGNAGQYRCIRCDRFDVQEFGNTYSTIGITLHTVASGNYGYRDASEAEFNQALR